MKTFLIFVAICGVVVSVFASMAKQLDAPQVYVSSGDSSCIKVVSPEGERPCKKGDEKKYERVWVHGKN